MFVNHKTSNVETALGSWGAEMPAWVRLLAIACDKSNQRAVADRIGRSGGYVSRIINRNYAGSYDEAEVLVRAAFGEDQVDCPLHGEIPLASCVRARRAKGPARTAMHHAFAETCPSCPHNGDRS